jgi:glycosyltransferase involved in cell wall biosynthesis
MLAALARHQGACPELRQEFALCFEGRLQRELASLGAATYSLGPARVSRPHTVLRGRRELRRLLAARGFDALVFHSAWSYAIFAPVAAGVQLPVAFWMHGTTAGKHWSERWARRVDPDVLICNSHFTASGAAALYPNRSAHVVYCPLELKPGPLPMEKRLRLRAELDTPAGAVAIVQVSRIERGKGHLLHLEALAALKSLPDWVCWFAGGPQRSEETAYFEEIRNAALRWGISGRVRFMNERRDVPMLLAAADIYCQPNIKTESFGVTLVEALNAALPVVTTDIGAANEIVDDACGILVAPGDAAQIAGTLRRLIEDASLRRRLGQAGPARARLLCDSTTRIKEFSAILAGAISSCPVHQP